MKKSYYGGLFLIIFLMILVGGIMFYMKNNKMDENLNLDLENKDSSDIDSAIVNLEQAPDTYTDYLTLEDGEYITKNGYTLVIKDGVASIDGILIVNKTYSLPDNYKPSDPSEVITGERCNNCLEKEVMAAFRLMQSDASTIGLNIYIASGYRSYQYQDTLYNNYSAVSGVEGADTYSARPGHSEHQTGLCFDLNSVDDSFASTLEGKWVYDNAYLYGFIIRYPKGKENITGYQYESWHLRYVGEKLASELYQDGEYLTLEEYYGITSSY